MTTNIYCTWRSICIVYEDQYILYMRTNIYIYCTWRPIYILYIKTNIYIYIYIYILYMKTNMYCWSYLAEFFLDWEMLHTTVVQTTTTHILCYNFFFRKTCLLWVNVEIIIEPDRPQMITRRMCVACWVPKDTHAHAHAREKKCIFFYCNSGCTTAPECYFALLYIACFVKTCEWETF